MEEISATFDAGLEEVGHPSANGGVPEEQRAIATMVPSPPPPPPQPVLDEDMTEAHVYHGVGMPHWDLGFGQFNEGSSFCFNMEEISTMFDAGLEEVGHPPVNGGAPEEQRATAMMVPSPSPPPPPPPALDKGMTKADVYHGFGMPDWDLGFGQFNEGSSFCLNMEEISAMFGAGLEEVGHPPTNGGTPEEQRATATMVPSPPPPPPPQSALDKGMTETDVYHRPGMPDSDLDFGQFNEDSYMEEILGMLGDPGVEVDESPTVDEGIDSGDEGNSNQADGTQSKPPTTRS